MNIEQRIKEYEQKHYGGHMPSHNKETLRLVLLKELEADAKWGAISNADKIHGYDDGEPVRK